jgi:hypothetical protein
MRFATTLLLVLLMATVAMADEKIPDTDNALPSPAMRGTLSGSLTADSPTWNRIFGGSVSLECASQVIDSSSDGQYFEMFCIEVDSADPIEAIVDPALTNIGDTVMTLYCDPFDVADPMTNVVSYDDDGGEGLLSAFTVADGITLTPGNSYWLVLSTFSTGAMGDFGIQTSDNVVECGSVALERTTLDALKATYK